MSPTFLFIYGFLAIAVGIGMLVAGAMSGEKNEEKIEMVKPFPKRVDEIIDERSQLLEKIWATDDSAKRDSLRKKFVALEVEYWEITKPYRKQ